MDNEQRRQYNSKNCSANSYLEFRGSVIVDSKTRDGKDYVCLDIVFNENVKIRLFNPEKSQRDRSTMSVLLSGLFEALGDDFNDIPPCRGGWHEFLSEVTETLNRRKYTMLYAKLTVNEAGYIICGEGRAFSKEPDLEYTDGDLHFLTVDEPVKSSKKEHFMPEYETFNFEAAEEITFEEVKVKPTEVTVYSEVTTVNNPVLEFLESGNVIEVEESAIFEGVTGGTNEGVNVKELAKNSAFDDLFPKLEEPVVVKHDIPVFDKPSDLDELFSKPPQKTIEGVNEGVNEGEEVLPVWINGEGESVSELVAETVDQSTTDYLIQIMDEKVEEEKPKKKAARPKIPKGQDPLRYIKGDPDDIIWDANKEPKKINFEDLPN